jgi:hypothetical protein
MFATSSEAFCRSHKDTLSIAFITLKILPYPPPCYCCIAAEGLLLLLVNI